MFTVLATRKASEQVHRLVDAAANGGPTGAENLSICCCNISISWLRSAISDWRRLDEDACLSLALRNSSSCEAQLSAKSAYRIHSSLHMRRTFAGIRHNRLAHPFSSSSLILLQQSAPLHPTRTLHTAAPLSLHYHTDSRAECIRHSVETHIHI